MSILGVTPTDIKKKLNPLNTPKGFLGSASAVTTEDVQETIDEWEETVLSRMPARYQDLSTYIDGEIVIGGRKSRGGATGTETGFQLSLFPVSNVHLYLNYLGKPWDARTREDELDPSYYTINPATGAGTFVGITLDESDTLIATYEHTGMGNSQLLRRIVKDLVAVEWARRLNPQDENFDQYTAWETQAYSDLDRMYREDQGKIGIKVLDDIELVHETVIARSTAAPFDASGAML